MYIYSADLADFSLTMLITIQAINLDNHLYQRTHQAKFVGLVKGELDSLFLSKLAIYNVFQNSNMLTTQPKATKSWKEPLWLIYLQQIHVVFELSKEIKYYKSRKTNLYLVCLYYQ